MQAIVLVEDKPSPSGPICSLSSVELETFKTYIKTHLKTRFISLLKYSIGAPIFFDKKPNNSFCLYINYWSLNNLTINNHYPLPLIRKSLYRLGQTKQFTQLDQTSAYYWMKIQEGDE